MQEILLDWRKASFGRFFGRVAGAHEFLARDSWESNVPFGWGLTINTSERRVESHSQTDKAIGN